MRREEAEMEQNHVARRNCKQQRVSQLGSKLVQCQICPVQAYHLCYGIIGIGNYCNYFLTLFVPTETSEASWSVCFLCSLFWANSLCLTVHELCRMHLRLLHIHVLRPTMGIVIYQLNSTHCRKIFFYYINNNFSDILEKRKVIVAIGQEQISNSSRPL